MDHGQIEPRDRAIAPLTEAIERDLCTLIVENRFGKAVLPVEDVPNVEIQACQQQVVLMASGNVAGLLGSFQRLGITAQVDIRGCSEPLSVAATSISSPIAANRSRHV